MIRRIYTKAQPGQEWQDGFIFVETGEGRLYSLLEPYRTETRERLGQRLKQWEPDVFLLAEPPVPENATPAVGSETTLYLEYSPDDDTWWLWSDDWDGDDPNRATGRIALTPTEAKTILYARELQAAAKS